MRMPRLAHSLFVCTGILRMAALLVPRKGRPEWLEEWRSELWHVWNICNQSHGSSALHRKEEITAFSLGAFKDAFCLRKHHCSKSPRQEFRSGTPARCIAALAMVAGASCIIAYCRPGVWNAVLPNSYRDAEDLVMVSRGGLESASFPTVQFSEYAAWKRNSGHLFTSLAFYQLTTRRLTSGMGASIELPIARASSNLFAVLGIPISFEVSGIAGRRYAKVLLSRSAWRKYCSSDPHVFGHILRVDGQMAMVAGMIEDEDWRLPGHADFWLLEDDHRLSATQADSEGYVLGHAAPSVFHPSPDGRRQMYVPRKDSGYDWFVCESLAERIREPLSIFLFALLLACLALPATTSLPLGEYPANRKHVPWTTTVRRWAFLSVKFILIVPIVYFASLDLAYGSGFLSVGASEFLELLVSFCALLFAFRWALRDQRKRCPVCLRTLTNPARVGQFSRNFLAWNGTELVCLSGHGLLHVPDIPTSWFSSQRWLYLDPSWSGLFPLGT
jgi:hypothetical protein